MRLQSFLSVFLLVLLVLASCEIKRGNDGAPELDLENFPDVYLTSETFPKYENKTIIIIPYLEKGIWAYKVNFDIANKPVSATAMKELTPDGHTRSELNKAENFILDLRVTFGKDSYRLDKKGNFERIGFGDLLETPTKPAEKTTFTLSGITFLFNKKGLWAQDSSKEWKYIPLENPAL